MKKEENTPPPTALAKGRHGAPKTPIPWLC